MMSAQRCSGVCWRFSWAAPNTISMIDYVVGSLPARAEVRADWRLRDVLKEAIFESDPPPKPVFSRSPERRRARGFYFLDPEVFQVETVSYPYGGADEFCHNRSSATPTNAWRGQALW